MKTSVIIKIVAMAFVTIVAILLSLLVFGIVDNNEISEALIKTIEMCGILTVLMVVISFINKIGSKKIISAK